MAHRKTLNAEQLGLLQWVADGCPESVYEGVSHRISAAALSRRDLIKVSGGGARWRAEITEAGRAYLERSKIPGALIPRQANRSVTEELVASVIGAGGSLTVPDEWGPGRTNYTQRIQAANRHGKVPPGKRLVLSRVDRDQLEIRLEDAIPGTEVALHPVPVPERVARYTEVARRFRDEAERHEVSRTQLARATRIVQAIATEAEHRGYDVSITEARDDRSYVRQAWTGARDGHVSIAVGGHRHPLRISEEGLPSRAHWDRGRPWGRSWNPQTNTWDQAGTDPRGSDDAKGSGRLCIALVETFRREGRAGKWADRKSWSVEEKLPELFREIEIRTAEAEHRAREAELLAQERERQREAAIEAAKERYIDHYRGRVLEAQVEDWQKARAIRDYCDALEASSPQEVGKAGGDWVEWARAFADRIDPVAKDSPMPADPEITMKDLDPFLEGWSPYGLDRW